MMGSQTDLQVAFAGTPQRYRYIALAVGLGTHVYLYCGMLIIRVFWQDKSWVLSWPFIAGMLASAFCLSFLSYRTMMRLDARFVGESRVEPAGSCD